jgi:hypothetical protein
VAQPDEGRLGKTILLQQLDGEIALWQVLEFRRKFVGQKAASLTMVRCSSCRTAGWPE